MMEVVGECRGEGVSACWGEGEGEGQGRLHINQGTMMEVGESVGVRV